MSETLASQQLEVFFIAQRPPFHIVKDAPRVKGARATSGAGEYLSGTISQEKQSDEQVKDQLKAVVGSFGAAEKSDVHYNIAVRSREAETKNYSGWASGISTKMFDVSNDRSLNYQVTREVVERHDYDAHLHNLGVEWSRLSVPVRGEIEEEAHLRLTAQQELEVAMDDHLNRATNQILRKIDEIEASKTPVEVALYNYNRGLGSGFKGTGAQADKQIARLEAMLEEYQIYPSSRKQVSSIAAVPATRVSYSLLDTDARLKIHKATFIFMWYQFLAPLHPAIDPILNMIPENNVDNSNTPYVYMENFWAFAMDLAYRTIISVNNGNDDYIRRDSHVQLRGMAAQRRLPAVHEFRNGVKSFNAQWNATVRSKKASDPAFAHEEVNDVGVFYVAPGSRGTGRVRDQSRAIQPRAEVDLDLENI